VQRQPVHSRIIRRLHIWLPYSYGRNNSRRVQVEGVLPPESIDDLQIFFVVTMHLVVDIDEDDLAILPRQVRSVIGRTTSAILVDFRLCPQGLLTPRRSLGPVQHTSQLRVGRRI
jgi:hypothetical protein